MTAKEARPLLPAPPSGPRAFSLWLPGLVWVISSSYLIADLVIPRHFFLETQARWCALSVLGLVPAARGVYLYILRRRGVRSEVAAPRTDADMSRAREAFMSTYRRSFSTTSADGRIELADLPLVDFFLRVTNPSLGVARWTKRIALQSGYLQVADELAVDLERTGGLVPILKAQKGLIRDQLVAQVDGEDVGILSRFESQGLSSYVVRELMSDASADLTLAGRQKLDQMTKNVDRIVGSDELPSKREFAKVMADIAGLRHDAKRNSSGHSLQTLFDGIKFLAQNFMVVCLVPPAAPSASGRRKLSTCYRQPIGPHGNPRSYSPSSWHNSGIADRARAWFGLDQRIWELEFEEAFDCPSLHVHVSAPEGLFFFRGGPLATEALHYVEKAGDQESYTAKILSGAHHASASVGFESTFGLNYAHVYFKNFNLLAPQIYERQRAVDLLATGNLADGAAGTALAPTESRLIDRQPRIRLEFRERPPGILPILIAAGVLSLALLIESSVNFASVFGGSTNVALTALQGAPLVLVGWVLGKASADSLRRLSLPSALALAWFVADALLGLVAVVGMSLSSRSATHTVSKPGTLWFLLLFLTSMQLLTTLYMYVARQIRYARALRYGQPRGLR